VKDKYPEIERLNIIKEKSQLCGEFLEWLQTKFNMIAKKEGFEHGHIPMGYSSYINVQNLLAEYFDINLEEIEKEKLQMLEDLRKA
jgi:hypothetical protein